MDGPRSAVCALRGMCDGGDGGHREMGRFGGGLLGTVPSTIVPAGSACTGGGEDVLSCRCPWSAGHVAQRLFLGAWVVIPRWFPPLLLVLTTVGWCSGACSAWCSWWRLTNSRPTSASNNWRRPACPCSSRCGVQSTSAAHAQGDQPCLNPGLVARGVMAATAIGIAVGFSGLGFPTLLAGQRFRHFPHQHGGVVVGPRSRPCLKGRRADDAGRCQRGGVRQRRDVVAARLRSRRGICHRLGGFGGWLVAAGLHGAAQAPRQRQRLTARVQRGAAGMSTTLI